MKLGPYSTVTVYSMDATDGKHQPPEHYVMKRNNVSIHIISHHLKELTLKFSNFFSCEKSTIKCEKRESSCAYLCTPNNITGKDSCPYEAPYPISHETATIPLISQITLKSREKVVKVYFLLQKFDSRNKHGNFV